MSERLNINEVVNKNNEISQERQYLGNISDYQATKKEKVLADDIFAEGVIKLLIEKKGRKEAGRRIIHIPENKFDVKLNDQQQERFDSLINKVGNSADSLKELISGFRDIISGFETNEQLKKRTIEQGKKRLNQEFKDTGNLLGH